MLTIQGAVGSPIWGSGTHQTTVLIGNVRFETGGLPEAGRSVMKRGGVVCGGGGASRLNEYAGWYLQVYVLVRLLRKASSMWRGGGGGLPTHGGGVGGLFRYAPPAANNQLPASDFVH